MQKILDYIKWFDPVARFCLLVWAAISTYRQGTLLFVIVLLLILLDIGRRWLQIIRRYPTIFSIISIVLCMLILADNRNDMIQVYYFFLLDEIFEMPHGKLQNSLITFHFAGFITAECYAIYIIEHQNFGQNFYTMFILLGAYAFLLLIFAVIHYYKWDRDKLKVLNTKLIEYSFQEREYLVANERSHISQELHDSMGHSLMAALMNVRYLKAIKDKSPEEKNRQIDELEELLKECVANLRGSVYNLKELDENINLREEVERITNKFNNLGLIKIRMDIDDKTDKAPSPVKNVLYKTIREGITNSIKHGNATSIQIHIHYVSNQIELILKDNGSGCAKIHKSLGLNGIIDRIKKINGEVWFTSVRNKGFTIKVLLPGGNEN